MHEEILFTNNIVKRFENLLANVCFSSIYIYIYIYCGGSETPCNIARYYVMIVHCMISVLFLVYKLAYFGIQLTNTVSVFST